MSKIIAYIPTPLGDVEYIKRCATSGDASITEKQLESFMEKLNQNGISKSDVEIITDRIPETLPKSSEAGQKFVFYHKYESDQARVSKFIKDNDIPSSDVISLSLHESPYTPLDTELGDARILIGKMSPNAPEHESSKSTLDNTLAAWAQDLKPDTKQDLKPDTRGKAGSSSMDGKPQAALAQLG